MIKVKLNQNIEKGGIVLMTHELLAVKLDELDEAIGRFHARIESSQTDTLERLLDSIENLRCECTE